ncbi:MAG: helix-turn-helix transcriptional regulator [Opitutae bacterium]|nr:helix-turn-helix transcriptional regulator [Opitutae bacterium]
MRFSHHESGGVVKLTPAEAEVVAQAVRGLTNKEIARALRKSELTVRNQLTAVYRKLGLKRRLQLIAQFRG